MIASEQLSARDYWATLEPSSLQLRNLDDQELTLNSPLVLAAMDITAPAGGEDFLTVSPAGNPPVPANHFGFATFAFKGPPGAVRADAYVINPNATVGGAVHIWANQRTALSRAKRARSRLM